MYFLGLKNLHHAYAIEGAGIAGERLIEFFEKNLGIAAVGNPDFFHESFETLTIDDARRIREIHAGKAFSADVPRIFLIEMHGATREAQNALLKILEEPEPGNHFFLVVPSFDILLPTLKSRLQLVRDERAGKASVVSAKALVSDNVADFIKKSLKEKIAFVDDIAAEISDGKKAKHDALSFLNDVELAIYAGAHARTPANIAAHAAAFEAIASARSYMNDRAPSVKMLLEYVALSL